MSIGKIAVIRRPFESLKAAFTPAEGAAVGTNWTAFSGKNGATFGAQKLEDGTLVMPFVGLKTDEELALHLREILGDFLDTHDDERGVFVLAEGPLPDEARYDAMVARAGAFSPKVAADDPRLRKQAGWLFSTAARDLHEAMPDAETRASARAADEDPIAKAEEKFGQVFTAQNSRENLRRTLSAAIDHSIEDSALGAGAKPPEPAGPEALDKTERDLEVPLKRAFGSNPKVASELESLIRTTVEKDLKDAASEDEAAPEKKAE